MSRKKDDIKIQKIENLLSKAFVADQDGIKEKSKNKKRLLFRNAEKFYRDVISIDKKNLSAIRGLARVALHTSQTNKALKIYENGLRLADHEKKHYFLNGIANCYRYMAEFNPDNKKYLSKALDYYKKIPPKIRGVIYWSNLAITYAGLKKWKEAIFSNNMAQKKLLTEGVNHGNLEKILELESKLYKEYSKKTILEK